MMTLQSRKFGRLMAGSLSKGRAGVRRGDGRPSYRGVLSALDRQADRLGMVVETIGEADGYPLVLAKPRALTAGRNVLVVAGFHGEEPAGPMGAVEFLESAPDDLLEFVNLSVVPVVNPFGFETGMRYGPTRKPTNQVRNAAGDLDPSDNCKVLMGHGGLKDLSRDLVLDLHENVDVGDEFYLYVHSREREAPPTVDAKEIASQAAMRHFAKRKDGHYRDTYPGAEEYDVEGGVVWNARDGSYDDLRGDDSLVVVAETPAGRGRLEKRAGAHADLVASLASYFSEDADPTEVMLVPKASQTTRNSCGGACLRAVMRYHGIDVPERKVNQMAGVKRDGIDPDRIRDTAREFGLEADLLKGMDRPGLEDLLRQGAPVIVAIVAWGKEDKDYSGDDDGHYVVAIGCDRCRVYFEDPSLHGVSDKGFLDWREFGTRWHDVDGRGVAIPVWGGGRNMVPRDSLKYVRVP